MYSYIKRRFLDIPYCDQSDAQKLDIYLPDEGEGPFPVLFHVHGGGFFMLDKADHQLKPYLFGLERGYAVVSANYRMSGEAKFPAGIVDCKTAIRFLRANANLYHLDSDKIITVGGSSGGNYSEMLCVAVDIPELEDLSQGYQEYSSRVSCGIAWYAPTNFLLMDEQIEANGLTHAMGTHNADDSPESMYVGGGITKLPRDKVQAANPITYISAHMPPMLLQHGKKDRMVPYQQSEMFCQKACELAGDGHVELDLFENAEHCDPAFETRENMDRVFEFIERHLNKIQKPGNKYAFYTT